MCLVVTTIFIIAESIMIKHDWSYYAAHYSYYNTELVNDCVGFNLNYSEFLNYFVSDQLVGSLVYTCHLFTKLWTKLFCLLFLDRSFQEISAC